jgi:hypothetical protein
MELSAARNGGAGDEARLPLFAIVVATATNWRDREPFGGPARLHWRAPPPIPSPRAMRPFAVFGRFTAKTELSFEPNPFA